MIDLQQKTPLRALPVVAKRKSRYRGPVGPRENNGTEPEDRTGAFSAVKYNLQ